MELLLPMPVSSIFTCWMYTNNIAKAIEINPSYAKAYYRRGLSYLAILRPTDAVKSFKSALKLDPGNTAIRSQLDATIKLVRRIEFEKVRTILCLLFLLLLLSPIPCSVFRRLNDCQPPYLLSSRTSIPNEC